MSKLPSAHFRTNVLIKSIIGKDLINNDNVAILELVKNSFDASSKIVNIIFQNIKENDDQLPNPVNMSRIIIQDFGTGMTKKDIKDKWLNIAYSEKKYKKKYKGRFLAGSKGIGRFSCDRLGEYLNMYTKTPNSNYYMHLYVDWKKFEIENKKDLEIQKIPVELKRINYRDFELITGYKHFKNGTILEICKLRNKWTHKLRVKKKTKRTIEKWNIEKLIDLRKYLERLINPNQAYGIKNKFKIKIIADEFKEEDKKTKKADEIINGDIKNKIFEELDFRTTSIFSSISRNGKTMTTTLNDKGREIFSMIENIEGKQDYNHLNGVQLTIYYLNTYAKAFFTRQMGVRPVNFGSIFLFRNGFRIPPYGDEGDDWLNLEVRKGQGQRRFLGTRDLVGRVELIDNKGVFQEVSSREGLVENLAYQNLKNNFIISSIRKLEKYVVDGLNWDSIPNEMRSLVNKKDLSFEQEVFSLSQEEKDKNAIEAISSIVKTNSKDIIKLRVNSNLISALATEEIEKFDEIYDEFEKFGINKINKDTAAKLKEIQKVLERKERELSLLKQKSVSVNTDDLFARDDKDSKEVEALQHHINQSSERIITYIEDLKNMLIINSTYDVLIEIIDKISFENRKVLTLSKFVTKAKFDLLSSGIEKDLVHFILEYIENVYRRYPDKKVNKTLLKVIIFMKEGTEFKCMFRPIDFVIIIDNLLDNAYKAGAKNMEITIEKKYGELELKFRDNGLGLSPKIKNINDIFKFGYTTFEHGTGIGLYHVKSILNKMRSNIKVNTNLNQGLEFIINIKK